MDQRDQVEREVRAAQNEALFRSVNERLEALAETFQFIAETTSFICECSDTSCTEQMSLTVAEYEALRARPNQFAVRPGHVFPDMERVVTQNEEFVVVEKVGKGAEVAEDSDPRQDS